MRLVQEDFRRFASSCFTLSPNALNKVKCIACTSRELGTQIKGTEWSKILSFLLRMEFQKWDEVKPYFCVRHFVTV